MFSRFFSSVFSDYSCRILNENLPFPASWRRRACMFFLWFKGRVYKKWYANHNQLTQFCLTCWDAICHTAYIVYSILSIFLIFFVFFFFFDFTNLRFSVEERVHTHVVMELLFLFFYHFPVDRIMRSHSPSRRDEVFWFVLLLFFLLHLFFARHFFLCKSW